MDGVIAVNGCPQCLEKLCEIDELKDELRRVKDQLRYQARQGQEGFLGSSTPSSKLPVKRNTGEQEQKPRGAKPGHKGNGRKSHDGETAGTESESRPF